MKISNILGFSEKGNHVSAHETHFGTIAYDNQGQAHHVIYKKNKHPGRYGQQASELEASFTAIANAFTVPHHALQQDIVTNGEGKIVGVCSEHAAHALLRMHQSNPKITFMQATHPFSDSGEVTEIQFNQWLDKHQAIALVPTEEKWAQFVKDFQNQNKGKNFHQEYIRRLEGYWKERRQIGELDIPEEEFKNYLQLIKDIESEGEEDNLEKAFAIPEKLKAMILNWTQLKQQCQLKTNENVQQEAEIASLGAGKGFNFLDKLPQNFFAMLMDAKRAGKVQIDMDSLADVFTTAYGLEEDDLHKGNIGYYVTSEAGKLCFHFFKIDHDLMFSDKVMSSRGSPRFANLSYTEKKFRISRSDLKDFPDLQYSGNHYWPTKKVIFGKGDKAYHSRMDREAYKQLKHDEEFKRAEWKRFLKQAVMPNEFVIECLKRPLESTKTNVETADTLAVVQRATASRMSELRVALLETPEFRQSFKENNEEWRNLIFLELSQHAAKIGCTAEEIKAYLFETEAQIDRVLFACEFYEQNTSAQALHAAIYTQSYRCYETTRYFKNSLNTTDTSGETALDLAIRHYKANLTTLRESNDKNKQEYYQKMTTYYADVICDLDRHQALYTIVDPEAYNQILREAKNNNSLSQLPIVENLHDYKCCLENIRKQPWHSLKEDKVSAVALLEKARLSKEDLEQLRKELRPTEPAAPLKFIKELRSEIWIVKKIRGAYGITTTVHDMQQCIDRKLKELDNQERQEARTGFGRVNMQSAHRP